MMDGQDVKLTGIYLETIKRIFDMNNTQYNLYLFFYVDPLETCTIIIL
jgi:hypothetical protein